MKLHHRRSIRLQDYDYSSKGSYFLTIVTHLRQPLFGAINDETMELNLYGEIVWDVWNSLPVRYPQIELDEAVVMPNHFHGVIHIVNPVGAIHESPLQLTPKQQSPQQESPQGSTIEKISRRRMLLPLIVGYFKMNSAKRINLLYGLPGIHVWQRNYYEHIIGDNREYEQVVEYIHMNPFNWLADKEYLA